MPQQLSALTEHMQLATTSRSFTKKTAELKDSWQAKQEFLEAHKSDCISLKAKLMACKDGPGSLNAVRECAEKVELELKDMASSCIKNVLTNISDKLPATEQVSSWKDGLTHKSPWSEVLQKSANLREQSEAELKEQHTGAMGAMHLAIATRLPGCIKRI
eukprot:5537425-Amphidinium_carterae.1